MKNIAYKNILEGNWEEIKGEIQRKWGDLTDDDLDKVNGSYKKFIGRLQKTYGYSTAELEREVTKFFEQGTLEKLKDNALRKINDVKEIVATTLEEYYDVAKERTYATEQAVVDYIKENPIKVIGFAAAAGLLVNCFIKSRR